MPIIAIDNLASVGLIKDMSGLKLPFSAWESARNVQFQANAVRSRRGDVERVSVASFAPKALFFTASTLDRFLVMAGDAKVHAVIPGGTTRNITRTTGDYAASNVRWTGGSFNGIFVLNAPTDIPQYWVPGTATPELQNMPAWNTNHRAGVIRPFKNFLIAMDITKSGTRDPHLVKWGHPADPGDLPITWDETDTTRDAGEFPLSDSPGYIVDGLPMRDTFIIYKEDAVWTMQLTFDSRIFSFRKLYSDIGILAPKCAVQLPNGQHAVMSIDDIYVHNGQSWQSIVDDRMKDYIFSALGSTAADASFAVVNQFRNEVMFCVPFGEVTYPNIAFCWNYLTNTWSERDLHDVSDIAAGVLPDQGGGVAWNDRDISITWDSTDEIWSERSGEQTAARIYGAYPVLQQVREIGVETNFHDAPVVAEIERANLGVPMQQDRAPDMHSVKFFRGMRPLLTGTNGDVVQVDMGVQQRANDTPTWLGPFNYTIGSTEFVDIRGSGRLFAVRFSSSGVLWQLHGYELDVEFGGQF